jgi:hypothetical protein
MALTTTTYPGKIDFPTETEGPFEGIIYGAACNVPIVYDSAKVPLTGLYEYLTNEGTDGLITINISGLTFEGNSDNSGSPGWPIIQFNQGLFSGISYYSKYTIQNVTYVFSVNGLDWNIVNAATNEVMASGTISNQPDA